MTKNNGCVCNPPLVMKSVRNQKSSLSQAVSWRWVGFLWFLWFQVGFSWCQVNFHGSRPVFVGFSIFQVDFSWFQVVFRGFYRSRSGFHDSRWIFTVINGSRLV